MTQSKQKEIFRDNMPANMTFRNMPDMDDLEIRYYDLDDDFFIKSAELSFEQIICNLGFIQPGLGFVAPDN